MQMYAMHLQHSASSQQNKKGTAPAAKGTQHQNTIADMRLPQNALLGSATYCCSLRVCYNQLHSLQIHLLFMHAYQRQNYT
jgi:hypothetical protein